MGFCFFNNAAIGAQYARSEREVTSVAIVDLDVHQGDGTAAIFADDPSVTTFSMHGATNFPFRKARSDLDVALPESTGDEAYLQALADRLPEAFDRTDPDLAVYLAGADVLADDRLGTFELTPAGVRRRDEHVLSTCRQRGLPTTIVMGGGYGDPLSATIEAQCATFDVAIRTRQEPSCH